MLDPSEKIVWRGKPSKTTYLSLAFGGIPFALFFLFFALIFHVFFGFHLLEPPVLMLIAVAIGLIIIPPFWRLKKFTNEEYMITNQRLLIKSGITRDNIWFVELDKIKEIIVKKGFFDKIFSTTKIYPITAFYPYAPKSYWYDTSHWSGFKYIPPWKRVKKVYNLAEGKYEEVPQSVLYTKTQTHPHLEALKQPHIVEKLLRETIKK